MFWEAESLPSLSHVCDLRLAGAMLHLWPFFEPQGLCCSKQGSYPFPNEAVHTPLCLPSLPDITDRNDLWDRPCTQRVKAAWQTKVAEGDIQAHKVSGGDTVQTAPSWWNRLIYSRSVSERGVRSNSWTTDWNVEQNPTTVVPTATQPSSYEHLLLVAWMH